MLEGLRGYLQLASGLTEVSRQRALATAKTLLSQGGAGVEQVLPAQVREQVTGLADELLATSRANRDLLLGLVRSEVERSVSVLGLVSAEELDSANRRAARLESRLRELEQSISVDQGGVVGAPVAARGGSGRVRPASSTTGSETPAATTGQVRAGAAATKASAPRAPSTKAPSTKAPSTKAPSTRAPSRKATATKAASPKASPTAARAAAAKAGRSVTGPSTSAPARSRLATTPATQRSTAVRAARKGAAQAATERAKATKAAVGDASRSDEPATGSAGSRSGAQKAGPATDASSAS